jgi:hypothetical protein
MTMAARAFQIHGATLPSCAGFCFDIDRPALASRAVDMIEMAPL